MHGMLTLALSVSTLISLLVAAIAIGRLSIVSKNLSALSKRVLESEDIGRIIQAADETASFESRMTGCESKADESRNQLVEHETKLSELAAKQGAVDQTINKHTVDLAMASEEMASSELRFTEFENEVGDKLNKLVELETKVNELASKLESVEKMVNNYGSGLDEIDRSIKALTDKIEILQKFQTVIEKTHSIIQAALTDMRASMPCEEDNVITSEIAEPEEILQGPEDEHKEAAYQKTSERYPF